MATELGKAFVQIVPSAKGISGSISNMMAPEATSAGRTSGQGFGSALVGMAKKVIAAAGIGTALKAAFSEGAALEQSLGGIETLYKENADKMKTYANEAYKTAGMSANQYMENVTSFSAGLIKSVGGDTAKAGDIANMAMIDMSDNANKMGSSMESIQNAYQGFAKQNYTMLDNLKLGYGGTKEEMQRLLADAEKISGVKYDMDNLSDVYNAIHVIQQDLDITGTTAKEASQTFSGSFAAMKASAKNFLGVLTNGGSVVSAARELGGTLITFIKGNFLPMLTRTLTGVPQALVEVLRVAGPGLLDAGLKAVEDIVKGIDQALPIIIPQMVKVATTMLTSLIQHIPMLVEGAIQLVQGLAQGLIAAIPILVAALPQIIDSIISALLTSIPLIIQAGVDLLTALIANLPVVVQTIVAALPQIITGILGALVLAIPLLIQAGIDLLTALIGALPVIIQTIVDAMPQIVDSIVTTLLDNIDQIIQAGIDLLVALIDDLPVIIQTIMLAMPRIISSIVKALIEKIDLIIQAGVDLLVALIENLPLIIQTIADALPQIINGIVTTLIDNIDLIIQAGVQLLVALIKNLPTIIVEIVKHMPEIIMGIVNGLLAGIGEIVEVGCQLVRGLWDGIKSLASWLWDKVTGWISGIWQGIKDFFGIKSPSREMAWIGKMLDHGLAKGIVDNVRPVTKAMNKLGDLTMRSFQTDLAFDASISGASMHGSGLLGAAVGVGGGIYITNYNQSPEPLTEREIARQTRLSLKRLAI